MTTDPMSSSCCAYLHLELSESHKIFKPDILPDDLQMKSLLQIVINPTISHNSVHKSSPPFLRSNVTLKPSGVLSQPLSISRDWVYPLLGLSSEVGNTTSTFPQTKNFHQAIQSWDRRSAVSVTHAQAYTPLTKALENSTPSSERSFLLTLLLGKPFISRAALSNDLTKILLSTNILTISSIELVVLTKYTHSALTYSS